MTAHEAARHLSVRLNVCSAKSLALEPPGPLHALANRGGCLTHLRRRHFIARQSGNFDLEVDAIEERTGDLREIASDLDRRARALATRVVEKPAWARIQRGRESEARRERHRLRGAGDRDE